MRVTKNGICREIDPKRAQEFREKGYTFECDRNDDNVEVLKQENEALKTQMEALKAGNEALKAEIEALLKSQVETLNPQVGGEENGESGESEQASTDEKSEKAGKAEATARAKK